jgi:pSer/pThr/pTyr-binding forkhead associated (FHA) protein
VAMYKYSCRKCPIRNRCIRESRYTTSVKNMIRSAFEVKTDTLATWGLLQSNCLLIKAEEEQERRAQEETTLQRRLREARESKRKATAELLSRSQGDTTKSLIRRLPQARKAEEESEKPVTKPYADLPEYLLPVTQTSDKSSQNSQTPDLPISSQSQFSPEQTTPCWFTVKGSNRHILLPASGKMVLGRFDATFGVPPDIDLGYEDADHHTVSRRHAKVVGINGYHRLEDTGSRYGVFVNGEQLNPGIGQQLRPGDRVAIGNVQMFYDQIPEYLQELSPQTPMHHILIITPTGRKLTIVPPHSIVIGRSDRFVDFIPEIDLSRDGEAASKVSRRHAVIQWRNNQPHLEDLGSGFGTRINGQIVLIGQSVPLKPGDHIWLGGCVLAYDVEL